MGKPDSNLPLAADIRAMLAGLRWRIRAYVWLEGLALALAWIALTFWIALALDYLPVLAGASEMPQAARAVLLAIIAVVLAWILYRWILRRTWVRLADHSMAVLLERRFAQFSDSLVTTVEMHEHPDHAEQYDGQLLDRTHQQARQALDQVRLRQVFHFTPLLAKLAAAGLLLLTIGAFYALNAPALELSVQRLYLLQDQPWPRWAKIEVVGVEVPRPAIGQSERPPDQLLPFNDHRVKVGKGASVKLHVRASAAAGLVPEQCRIYYQTEEGDRGRAPMQKIGRIRDGFQTYTFDGQPFKGVLSSLQFDVVGYDHRVRNYHLQVVDNPVLVETTLDCVFPEYMVDTELASWLPRTEDWTPGTQLPRGTDVTLRFRSNKDLYQVHIHNPDTGQTETQQFEGQPQGQREFSYRVAPLEDNLTLDILLHDTDQVTSERSHRIHIAAVADEPPRVNVALRGIGTAVTPDVVLPARGQITDDYGVGRAWFEVQANDDPPREEPLALRADGRVEQQIDFREIRSRSDGFQLQPQDKLALLVKAEDNYDLEGEPNLGSGDRYQLEVVTADELLARLEARELGLRRRFEQIIDEMTETRDSLHRVKAEATGGLAGTEPEDATGTGPDEDSLDADSLQEESLDPETQARRARALRLLRVQRALLQSRKSAQEVFGVASAFHDIRRELINNRVDSEDRRSRLKEHIADPLEQISENHFPELDRLLEQLENRLGDQAELEAADRAIAQADHILIELDAVLQRMLELETYNELLAIVRSLMEEQERLIEMTRQERQREQKRKLEQLKKLDLLQ